jgi:hypothetical protein
MNSEKPKPGDPKKDPRQEPEQKRGQDPNRSSRTPDTEPPKEKRSDDL